jgi:hypothetical protein
LAQYPDHKAILTSHSYLDGSAGLDDKPDGTKFPLGNHASVLWEKCLKKHDNVLMVVAGHVGVTVPIYSYSVGDHGNRVLQVLVDPQSYDTYEKADGTVSQGTQDTGLVLYMNFSADGKTITFDYYSTLLNKFLKGSDYTIYLDREIDETGNIDLATLSQFGQNSLLVTEKKTAVQDAVISEGEYSAQRVIKKENIGSGKIASDLTEYFAYDDDYIYLHLISNVGDLDIKLTQMPSKDQTIWQ